MAEAFTAGVRPGGLTDDTQIRMLLCYLVKVAGPVKRETMQGALLQEQLVNYFEFADALAEVEKQQLVTVDEDDISEKAVRRAGLDYWNLVEVFDYENLEDFFRRRPEAERDLWLTTTKAPRSYQEARFTADSWLFFEISHDGGGARRGP